MGKFEELHIYPKILSKTLLYLRYIDDLFFIWKGTEEELKRFFQEINQVHRTIKFDYTYSNKEINFLDLIIYKNRKGKLQTKVYTKPTDRQSYLYRTSAHPEHLKKKIPYGQALRLKKICSEGQEFDKAAQLLSKNLKSRKYKDEEINIQISKAKSQNRDLLLQRRERKPLNRIPCVVTYNKKLPDIKGAIDRHWHLLKINSNLEPGFKENRLWHLKGIETLET